MKIQQEIIPSDPEGKQTPSASVRGWLTASAYVLMRFHHPMEHLIRNTHTQHDCKKHRKPKIGEVSSLRLKGIKNTNKTPTSGVFAELQNLK